MTEIDPNFCFYDDEHYRGDADRDSSRLMRWHQQLWSKELPSGGRAELVPEAGGYLLLKSPEGQFRVSSDTIATTHATYPTVRPLAAELGPDQMEKYEHAFYTIGGFIILPVRPQSLNQRRGTSPAIADRFDLTLECIRQHYVGQQGNPLSDVLALDHEYFALFGAGVQGFIGFVEFFHLQDLVADGSIRWFDGFQGANWDFASRPLPATVEGYRTYLDNVAAFVAKRNEQIRAWCDGRTGP